jgi:hypothetical protein
MKASVSIDRRHLHLKVSRVSSASAKFLAEDVYSVVNLGVDQVAIVDIPIEQIRDNLRVFSSSGTELTYLRNEEGGTRSPTTNKPGNIKVILSQDNELKSGERTNIVLRYESVIRPNWTLGTRLLGLLRAVLLFRVLQFVFLFSPWFATLSVFSVTSDEEPSIRIVPDPSWISLSTPEFNPYITPKHGYYSIVWEHIEPQNDMYTIPVEISPSTYGAIANIAMGYTLILLAMLVPPILFFAFITGSISLTTMVEGFFAMGLFTLTYRLIPLNEALILREPGVLLALSSLFLVSLLLFIDLLLKIFF